MLRTVLFDSASDATEYALNHDSRTNKIIQLLQELKKRAVRLKMNVPGRNDFMQYANAYKKLKEDGLSLETAFCDFLHDCDLIVDRGADEQKVEGLMKQVQGLKAPDLVDDDWTEIQDILLDVIDIDDQAGIYVELKRHHDDVELTIQGLVQVEKYFSYAEAYLNLSRNVLERAPRVLEDYQNEPSNDNEVTVKFSLNVLQNFVQVRKEVESFQTPGIGEDLILRDVFEKMRDEILEEFDEISETVEMAYAEFLNEKEESKLDQYQMALGAENHLKLMKEYK